jgi:hypothetical protein
VGHDLTPAAPQLLEVWDKNHPEHRIIEHQKPRVGGMLASAGGGPTVLLEDVVSLDEEDIKTWETDR